MVQIFVRAFSLVPLSLVVVLAGCSAAMPMKSVPTTAERRVITTSEIRLSGAENAWEVLEWSGTPLEVRVQRHTAESEERRSGLRGIPRVIVDGIQMFEIRLLRDIPAHLISSIRILSGTSDESPAGTEGEGDDEVILIRTWEDPKP